MRVLFVCVHNAGRSQMAKALFNARAKEQGVQVDADSAGTQPGAEVNPVAVEAMQEIGLSLAGETPKLLTPELANSADRIITMGCGVEASACPAGVYITEDWQLPDPHGQAVLQVRAIRDKIMERVDALLAEVKSHVR